MNYKIPKVIHYFWFGHNEQSELIKKCINSWKKYCPDYQIKRWDESNFDVNICPYVKEAYETKNWAYVSDYARFYILNKYGGVYLDTDVELLKSIDPIVKNGPFLALETKDFDSIAPGLGMATYSDNDFLKEILRSYSGEHFILKDGTLNKIPVGERVSPFFVEKGLKDVAGIQQVGDFKIYPYDYFCPLNYYTGEYKPTQNTVAIHHYASSWMSKNDKSYHKIGQFFSKKFGIKFGKRVEKVIRFPSSFIGKVKLIGLKKSISFYIKKYIKHEMS